MLYPTPDELEIDVLYDTLEKLLENEVISKYQYDKIMKEYIHRLELTKEGGGLGGGGLAGLGTGFGGY